MREEQNKSEFICYSEAHPTLACTKVRLFMSIKNEKITNKKITDFYFAVSQKLPTFAPELKTNLNGWI